MPSSDGSPEPRHSSPHTRWSDLRREVLPTTEDQEAAFQEMVRLTEELGLYDALPVKHGPDCIPGAHCFRCGRMASECYTPDLWRSYGSPSAYAVAEEGTYNEETQHFACDECYIAIGMPSTPYGWVAP